MASNHSISSNVFSGRINYQFCNFKLVIDVPHWYPGAFLEIMFTAVARYCPKNIDLFNEQEDENYHFKGVTTTKSLRNVTKHVKSLCLACFDMPFPHVAQGVAQ